VEGAEGGTSEASTGAKRTPEQARRQQGWIVGRWCRNAQKKIKTFHYICKIIIKQRMSTIYKTITFPKSRVATLDICEIGIRKHYITSFVEIDVTEARKQLKKRRLVGERNSFTSYLIAKIAQTLHEHPAICAFLKNKREIVQFDDVNLSIIIEKKIGDTKVPIPYIIKKAQKKSVEEITLEIDHVKKKVLNDQEIILHRKTNLGERLYPFFPKWVRLLFWKLMLKNPKWAYSKMGNVAFTSLGMVGSVSGWFTPITIHPVCFGVGSIVTKPRCINQLVEPREILHLTILMDHDVADGAPMARFMNQLIHSIEKTES
jgi:hypothetical protein